jgi:hypothetical protein
MGLTAEFSRGARPLSALPVLSKFGHSPPSFIHPLSILRHSSLPLCMAGRDSLRNPRLRLACARCQRRKIRVSDAGKANVADI